MSTEDAPFSHAQANGRMLEKTEKKWFFCFSSIDFLYFVIFLCLLKILSYQE